jgi:hypothetical protein
LNASGPGASSRIPVPRAASNSTTTATANTQRQAYTEDSSQPFAQAIESLREPRQGSGLSALNETIRRRARLEQLAEETRAMNRDRARVIRAEYVNRRRHTLNLRGFSLGDFMVSLTSVPLLPADADGGTSFTARRRVR